MSYKNINYGNMQVFSQELKNKYAKKTELNALSARIDTLVNAGGESNVLEGIKVNGTALVIAEKMVDILISAGSANGTITVNGADVAIKGLATLAYKAQVSQSDLDTALLTVINDKAAKADLDATTLRIAAAEGKLTTLIGSVDGDNTKSVRDISAEEVAKIVADAPEAYNTLKEIADWISDHADDASDMNSRINTNKTNVDNLVKLVGTLPKGATSATVVEYVAEAITAIGIGNYAKTTEVTSAINTALSNYYTKTGADSIFVKVTDIETVTDAEMKALLAE